MSVLSFFFDRSKTASDIDSIWRAQMNDKTVPMYSDEYLNYHADQFIAKRLAAHGVTLEEYLAKPDGFGHLEFEFEPLLPQQVAVQLRFNPEHEKTEALIQQMICRNGTLMEPMHHHRYPRTKACDFRLKAQRSEAITATPHLNAFEYSRQDLLSQESLAARLEKARVAAQIRNVDIVDDDISDAMQIHLEQHSERRHNSRLRKLVMLGSLMAEHVRQMTDASDDQCNIADMWERNLIEFRKSGV